MADATSVPLHLRDTYLRGLSVVLNPFYDHRLSYNLSANLTFGLKTVVFREFVAAGGDQIELGLATFDAELVMSAKDLVNLLPPGYDITSDKLAAEWAQTALVSRIGGTVAVEFTVENRRGLSSEQMIRSVRVSLGDQAFNFWRAQAHQTLGAFRIPMPPIPDSDATTRGLSTAIAVMSPSKAARA